MWRAVLAALVIVTPTGAQAAWKRLDFPKVDTTLRAVGVSGPARFHVSGSNGTYAVTNDGGKTWRMTSPPAEATFDFRGLAALDPRTTVLMSAGEAAKGLAFVYRTDDAGRTWQRVFQTTEPGGFLDAVAFRDRRTGFILGDPIDGRWFLLKTVDGGQSWARVSGPAVEPGEAAFAASNSALFLGPGREVWIVSGGLAKGRIAHSRDDGGSWDIVEGPLPGSASAGLFGGLALGKDRAVVVGGDYKDELRAGETIALVEALDIWTPPSEGTPRLIEGVGRLDPRTLIAVGPRGTALSADDGQSWRQVDTEAFHAIACRAGTCVAAGGKGHVGVWVRE